VQNPHPESVQQGPSTAIGVPDLRSKQGEFQHKTTQSIRHSTARSTSDHHTRRVSEPYTWWGTWPPMGNWRRSAARTPPAPPPPNPSAPARPGQPRSGAARTIFLTFKDLVGKSVYNSITAVEFLVSLSLQTVLADYDINVCS